MEQLAFLSLVFARAIGLIAVLPFEYTIVGIGERLLFSAGLAFIVGWDLYPLEPISPTDLPLNLLIGFTLGLPMALVVHAVEFWGELFDLTRGESGALYDAVGGGRSGVVSQLGRWLVWAFLLGVGILPTTVAAYIQSFDAVPIGIAPDLLALGRYLLTTVNGIMLGSMVALLPLTILFLCIELGVGFLGRALPQVSLADISFVAKTTLGGLAILGLLLSDGGHSIWLIATQFYEFQR